MSLCGYVLSEKGLPMAPLTITHRSTSSYLVECQGGMLLVDPGWAGSILMKDVEALLP